MLFKELHLLNVKNCQNSVWKLQSLDWVEHHMDKTIRCFLRSPFSSRCYRDKLLALTILLAKHSVLFLKGDAQGYFWNSDIDLSSNMKINENFPQQLQAFHGLAGFHITNIRSASVPSEFTPFLNLLTTENLLYRQPCVINSIWYYLCDQ